MKIIKSTNNQEIKDLVKLFDAKERYKQNLFIAEGHRTCKTLTDSGICLIQLYILVDQQEAVKEWAQQDQITIISPAILQKITQTVTPSGIVGLFEIPPAPGSEQLSPGIVLARIADPGNMGTLIRTCAALGKKTVVLIEGVDPWNAKVVQASAGTISKVDIFKWSWQQLITYKRTMQLVALVVKGGKKPVDLNLENSLLVIGSEAHGIPETWLKECDQQMTLSMPGNVESLNAAVAGSIGMYLAWHS